ncbi:MAG: hypothetical protein IT553_03545 [Sphingomonadaceae bacterium]|nr:hypothetical protein [Sphingomonadaceae bacterium]
MRRRLALSLCLTPLLTGCVAAVLPVMAAGTIARQGVAGDTGEAANTSVPSPPAITEAEPAPPAPVPAPETPPHAEIAPTPAVAQATTAMVDSDSAAIIAHVRVRAALVAEGAPVLSLILADPLTLAEPAYAPCGARPAAVIFDADRGSAVAGDVGALRQLTAEIRAANIAIFWVSDRPASATAMIADALAAADIDPAHVDSIVATRPGFERKQLLRHAIAESHCVLAVVGDTRADADEAYAYLRDPDSPLAIDSNWGNGWFLLPLPDLSPFQ